MWVILATAVIAGAAAPARGASVPADSTAVAPAVAAPDSATAGPQPVPAATDSLDIWHTGISPSAAVLMSPVFPGWGQLYARNSWRAGLAFGSQMFFWTNLISRDQRARRARDFAANFEEGSVNNEFYLAIGEEDWKQMRDFVWWSGGSLLILALDAYVGAHLFNFDRDPMPVPDNWNDVFGAPGKSHLESGTGPQVTLLQWRTTF
ncbi:hypothetical protein CO151_10410 [bacterium CG_4_9_14_3_um_filter_65_15]|nr:MAG: hypothetical protein CO151_10410 [bacterium CG_4_9_14_3_um_filter_65_15]